MKIVFDDISKICVTDCTIDEIDEHFPQEEFPHMIQTDDGDFLLFRRDENDF